MKTKPTKPTGPSCDWRAPIKKAEPASRRARLHRCKKDHSFTGIRTERYKAEDGTWAGVLRRTIIGAMSESTKFHVRYFEIEPGGCTSFEEHTHEHVVVALRGRGRCKVRRRVYELGPHDIVYIPPDAPHQLMNPTRQPFGFLCIVDAERDRPRPVGSRGRP